MKTAAAAFTALALLCAQASAATAQETTPPPSAPAATETAPAAATPSSEPPPAAAASKHTVWPWIIMGTGIGLVITAGVLELNAVKEDDQREIAETKGYGLQPGPEKNALTSSAADHDASAKHERTAATIVGTVGFLAIAGAVVLWFVESGGSPDPKAKSAAKPKPTFTPSLLPGYAGATFGATF